MSEAIIGDDYFYQGPILLIVKVLDPKDLQLFDLVEGLGDLKKNDGLQKDNLLVVN